MVPSWLISPSDVAFDRGEWTDVTVAGATEAGQCCERRYNGDPQGGHGRDSAASLGAHEKNDVNGDDDKVANEATAGSEGRSEASGAADPGETMPTVGLTNWSGGPPPARSPMTSLAPPLIAMLNPTTSTVVSSTQPSC